MASAGPEVETPHLANALGGAAGDAAGANRGAIAAGLTYGAAWIHGLRARTRGPAIRRSNWRCFADWKTAFPKLESHAKVGIGVATGNDSVFVTKDAHLVEPSRLLQLALAKDIGTARWSGPGTIWWTRGTATVWWIWTNTLGCARILRNTRRRSRNVIRR